MQYGSLTLTAWLAATCWMHPGSFPDALAQRVHGVTFAPTPVELPAEGLQFRVMRGGAPVGLTPPEVFVFRSASGVTEDRYVPRDLWYPSVHRGRWEDAAGVALTMAVLASLPPQLGEVTHVSRDEYHAAQADHPRGPPASWSELGLWISYFAEAPVQGTPRTVPSGPRLGAVLAYDFGAGDRGGSAYIFRFAPNVHRVDPDQWFVALFEWPAGTDGAAFRRGIEQDFIASLSTTARAEDRTHEAASRLQHPRLGAQVAAAARSPAFLESRERAVNSIRGLPGWWFVETPNYVLVSDLSGGNRAFIQRLQEELEAMREVYEKLFPPRRPIEAVSVVRVFADGEGYVQYVGPEHQHTGGVWMPGRRELVLRTFEWGNELERRARLAQTVYHEAFHQYIHYAFDLVLTSPWYNEGHATFFEGADSRRGSLRVDEVDHYAAMLGAMAAAGPLPVQPLLALDYDTFYERVGGDAMRRQANYALAWGLVYYLRKAAPLESEHRHEQIISRYEDALWQTRNAERATHMAFEEVDLAAFTTAFTDFWLSERHRHRARRNHEW